MSDTVFEKIKEQLTLTNIIAALALAISIPSLLTTLKQIREAEENDREAKLKIAQVETQLKLSKEQLDVIRKYSDSAALSADAANKSLEKLERQNFYAEKGLLIQRYVSYQANRPRIEFVEIKDIKLDAGSKTKWTVKFAKTGVPPANVRTWVKSEILKANAMVDNMPECGSNEFENRGSFQNGTIFVNGDTYRASEINLLKDGSSLYTMRGRVCYNDDEGALHAVDFCNSARGTTREWSYGSCNGFNNNYTLKLPRIFQDLDK